MKWTYNAIVDVQIHWVSSAFNSISRQIHQAECMTQARLNIKNLSNYLLALLFHSRAFCSCHFISMKCILCAGTSFGLFISAAHFLQLIGHFVIELIVIKISFHFRSSTVNMLKAFIFTQDNWILTTIRTKCWRCWMAAVRPHAPLTDSWNINRMNFSSFHFTRPSRENHQIRVLPAHSRMVSLIFILRISISISDWKKILRLRTKHNWLDFMCAFLTDKNSRDLNQNTHRLLWVALISLEFRNWRNNAIPSTDNLKKKKM